MLTRLITQAGQEITSDYERTELLSDIAKDRLMTTDEQRLAYTAATRTIDSSYEHRRALQPLVESGSLSDVVLRSALDSASNIESDYELAELLIALGKTQPLTPGGDGCLHGRGDHDRFRLRAGPRAQAGRQRAAPLPSAGVARRAEGVVRHRLRL